MFLFIHLCLQCISICIVTGNAGHNSHTKQQQRYDKQVLGILLLSWRCITKSSLIFWFQDWRSANCFPVTWLVRFSVSPGRTATEQFYSATIHDMPPDSFGWRRCQSGSSERMLHKNCISYASSVNIRQRDASANQLFAKECKIHNGNDVTLYNFCNFNFKLGRFHERGL